MSTNPLVSVVLPVYNGEKYLSEAIASILSQTFSDFEFIIIDDGSTDGSSEIVDRWAKLDRRIRVISRENRGLVYSLNEGINAATGKYIARMDADDVSDPRRFQSQVDYLECNSDVVLLGVRVYPSRFMNWRFLGLSGKLNTTWGLVFRNNVGHPGVMLRTDILKKHSLNYRTDYLYAEDFKLWSEMVRYGLADILPQSLLYYRPHDKSLSIQHRNEQATVDRKIVVENLLEKLGIDMRSHFSLGILSWIEQLTNSLLHCNHLSSLSASDVEAIHSTYQDYCASFGIGAFSHYARMAGARSLLHSGLFLPSNIYRSVKHSIKGSWRRLEISPQ